MSLLYNSLQDTLKNKLNSNGQGITQKDEWEKNFLEWIGKFLHLINRNKGKLNCDRCSLLLNDILSDGLPENGVQPVPVDKTSLITYPKFDLDGRIVSSKTFDSRILERFQAKKVDFGHFIFCEEEGLSDFRLVEMDSPQAPSKPPKPSDKIAWISSSSKTINEELQSLLRRKGTITWNNKDTIHGLVLLTYRSTTNWGHLINFVVGPKNQILFIDAQSGIISNTLPQNFRKEVYFLVSIPPEGYTIKIEANPELHFPRVKMEVGYDASNASNAPNIPENIPISKNEAIIKAITCKQLETVKRLISTSEDLNFEISLHGGYITPLHTALLAGFNMFKTLVEMGAKVTQPYLHAPHLVAVARSSNTLDPRILPFIEKTAVKEIAWIIDFDECGDVSYYDPIGRLRKKLAFLGDMELLKRQFNETYTNWDNCSDFLTREINIAMVAVLGGNVETLRFILQYFTERLGLSYNLKMNTTQKTLEFFGESSMGSLNEKITLLQVAGMGGHKEMLDYLKKEHSEFYHKFEHHIIFGAIDGDHLDLIQARLMDVGPNNTLCYNSVSGITALMRAAYKGKEPAFDLIMQKNPKLLEATDKNGNNVLMWAIKGKCCKMADKILKLKPELLLGTTKEGVSTLMLAASGPLEMVKLLFSYMSNLYLYQKFLLNQDNNLQSVLFYAIDAYNLEILKYIVLHYPESRQLLFSYNRAGHNALHHAILLPDRGLWGQRERDNKARLDIIRFLVSKECDTEGRLLHTPTKGGDLLVHMATGNDLSFFEGFLDLDPNMLTMVNDKGQTTLICALLNEKNGIYSGGNNNKIEILKYLLEKAPTLMFQFDNSGKSIFNYLAEPETLAKFDHIKQRLEDFCELLKKRASEIFNYIDPASSNNKLNLNGKLYPKNQKTSPEKMEMDGKYIKESNHESMQESRRESMHGFMQESMRDSKQDSMRESGQEFIQTSIQEKDALLRTKDMQIAQNANTIDTLKDKLQKLSKTYAGMKRSREDAGLPEKEADGTNDSTHK